MQKLRPHPAKVAPVFEIVVMHLPDICQKRENCPLDTWRNQLIMDGKIVQKGLRLPLGVVHNCTLFLFSLDVGNR